MPAVGGGVDRHVGRPFLQPPLQNGLEGRIGLVVPVKGQVVDEQDELLPPVPQAADQGGQVGQVVLVHLDQPQVLQTRDGQQALDGGRFAGTAVPIEQDVVHRFPLHQGSGVGHDLLPLELVAHHLALGARVRVGHGNQLAALPEKGPVLGKPARALGPVALGQRRKGERRLCRPAGQAIQNRAVFRPQQVLHPCQAVPAVQLRQRGQSLHVLTGRPFQLRVMAAPLR